MAQKLSNWSVKVQIVIQNNMDFFVRWAQCITAKWTYAGSKKQRRYNPENSAQKPQTHKIHIYRLTKS